MAEILNNILNDNMLESTVNKLFGSTSEVDEIEVTEEVEEMLQDENTVKAFTTEEMEETNKIVNMLIESGDTLHKVWINEDDNCIYCPECGEPIYECDYPEIETDKDRNLICPICEYIFD